MKIALARKTYDNITVVLIGFEGIKKLISFE
jgi:serine/threonine protein phosphatase PrpC